jgi:ribosomal protein S18 acetylase RimI-like enzyme
MSELQIRPAVQDDGAALGELDRETWSPLHAVMPRPRPPYEPFYDDTHRPEENLVAEIDDRLVGFIRIGHPTRLACNAHVRQIQGLVVRESARGHGVGRALLRAAALHARNQGARRLTLRVLGHNAPARRLYETEGFAVEGVLPGEFLLEGEYVDDVFMGRSLAE